MGRSLGWLKLPMAEATEAAEAAKVSLVSISFSSPGVFLHRCQQSSLSSVAPRERKLAVASKRGGSTTHGLLLVASVDGLEDKEDAEQEAAIAYLAASATTFLHCHDARRNQDEKNSLKGMMINEVYHHKQKLISCLDSYRV